MTTKTLLTLKRLTLAYVNFAKTCIKKNVTKSDSEKDIVFK